MWKPEFSLMELGNDFFLFKCEEDEDTIDRALTEDHIWELCCCSKMGIERRYPILYWVMLRKVDDNTFWATSARMSVEVDFNKPVIRTD